MREFGKDYLFRVSVEPEKGYIIGEKRSKPYYVVASNKEEARARIHLKSGWKIRSVSLLAEQYSGCLFGSS